MSVIGEVRATLDAMGVEQQACMFVFLMSYPLTLGALLEAKGRRIAGGFAAASAIAFAVFTDPWFHAVLLVVGGVGGVGLFIALVYLVDHVHRRFAAVQVEVQEESLAGAVEAAASAPPVPARERLPLSPAAPAKT